MKKILCLLIVAIGLFWSCIPNPEENPDPEVFVNTNVLLTKTIAVFNNGNVITTNYTYDGNKLVSIIDNNVSDPRNEYYTYTGDLITKIESKAIDGTIVETEVFSYNSDNKLTSEVVSNLIDNNGDKYNYVYSTDGTISVTQFIGNATTQTQLNSTETITFADGEVATIISSSGNNLTYTYDSKNNPLKNVTGMDKIAYSGSESRGILHNIIKEVNTLPSNAYTFTYAFTYANDYPISSTQDDLGVGEYTTQYFYSTDVEPVVDPNTVLLKKEIVSEVGGATTTTNFFYDGTKILKYENSNDTKAVFTYTGNLITKEETYTSNVIDHTYLFEYNTSNKLITYKVVSPSGNISNHEDYTYNTDGTISFIRYSSGISQYTGTITFLGDQAYKFVLNSTTPNDPFFDTQVNTYTFDAKNNPSKNVTGLKEIDFVDVRGHLGGVSNNVTSISSVEDSGTPSVTLQSYHCNINNFPDTSQQTLPSNQVFNHQYFY
jgi:hypothetical protein